ncbi:hypothetical protein AB0D50_26210, partial [Streptomyces sp. NPDC048309]
AMEGPTTGWRALGDSFGPDGWTGLVALLYTAIFWGVWGRSPQVTMGPPARAKPRAWVRAGAAGAKNVLGRSHQ